MLDVHAISDVFHVKSSIYIQSYTFNSTYEAVISNSRLILLWLICWYLVSNTNHVCHDMNCWPVDAMLTALC
jgi:hypothetical protein